MDRDYRMDRDTAKIEIYKMTLRNSENVEPHTPMAKKLKIIAYYLALIFLNRYKQLPVQQIHVINGRSELRLSKMKGYQNLYYGLSGNSLREFIGQDTVVTPFRRLDRLAVLSSAVFYYCKNKQVRENLAYWIDYCFWRNYIKKLQVKKLLSNGHYDRLTTMLSYLCKEKGIAFYMQQHGLLAAQQYIPVKVFCNRVYAYDQNEIKKFRKNVVANEDCIYEERYIHTVPFHRTAKDRYTIGIIEQPVPQMQQILRLVDKNTKGSSIRVMLHPLSSAERYKKYKGKNSIVFTLQKEMNLDLIVSMASTLAYDYVRSGFKGPILFLDEKHLFPEYQNLCENLIYIEDLQLLEKYIHDANVGHN